MDDDARIIATGLRMAALGLVAGTEGNLSVRRGPVIRVTPSSVPYAQIAPADLVTVDVAGGAIVEGHRPPTSELALHLAIYRARPDVDAIVHTHSPAALAWGRRNAALPAAAGAAAAHTAPPTPPGSQALAETALAALGPREAVLLGGHGVVAVGAGLDEALAVAIGVEERATAAGG